MKKSIALLVMSLLLLFSIVGANAAPSVSTGPVSTSPQENDITQELVGADIISPVGTRANPAAIYAPHPGGLTVNWTQYSTNPNATYPEIWLLVYDANTYENVYDSGIYPNLRPNSGTSYYHIPTLPKNRLLMVSLHVYSSDGVRGTTPMQYFIMK